MFQKKCFHCGSSFTTQHSTGKFCSKLCFQKYEKGKPGKTKYWLGKKRVMPWLSRLGKAPWNKGKTGYKIRPCSEETKRKISLILTGRKTDRPAWNKGMIGPRGEDSPAWRGGFTPVNKAIRLSQKYHQEWRSVIFKRDNRTCQICFTTEGVILVDHIIALSIVIHENNIKTLVEAYACAPIWDIKNGRVLCENCHRETDNFGGKVLKQLTRN